MTNVSTPESLLTQLEKTVFNLLHKLDKLRKENLHLRAQLDVQALIGQQLIDKNSRASQAIARVIASIEGTDQ